MCPFSILAFLQPTTVDKEPINLPTIKRILSRLSTPDNMRSYDFTDFFVQTR